MGRDGERFGRLRAILLESTLVAVFGVALALVANSISPEGLKLARNYFPAATSAKAPATNETQVALVQTTNSVRAGATNTLAQRLAVRGFRLVDSNFVAQAFGGPLRTQQLLIFVDARDDSHYQKGHIPGAYLLDYYHPESYLPAVLPAASVAEQIVVYCNGGDCEDSEFSAALLKDAGVPAEKLLVYGGGFAEWSTNNMPVEIGAKDSQRFLER